MKILCLFLLVAAAIVLATTTTINATNRGAYFDSGVEYTPGPGSPIYVGNLGRDLQGAFQFQVSGPVSGDTVDSCTLSLYVASNGPVTVEVYAGLADNAAVFDSSHTHMADVHFNPSSTGLTGTHVSWAITNSTGFQTSPELKTVCQQVISRGGWSSGNYLALILDGASSTNGQYVTFDPYAGGAHDAYLDFTYTHGAIKKKVVFVQ